MHIGESSILRQTLILRTMPNSGSSVCHHHHHHHHHDVGDRIGERQAILNPDPQAPKDSQIRFRPAPLARKGRFPYMVILLDRKDKQVCAGTLIYPSWVLTAAHCLHQNGSFDVPPLGLNPQIKLGALRVSQTSSEDPDFQITVGTGILHPGWNGKVSGGHDIALLKLPKPSNITPIGLPTRRSTFNDKRDLIAAGWGQRPNGLGTSDRLRRAFLKYRSTEVCNKKKWWNGRITDGMMCAGGIKAEVCKGDSGGPLIQDGIPIGLPRHSTKHVLVGVTSFGDRNQCNEDSDNFEFGKPAVFTRVTEYLDWIYETVQQDSNANHDDDDDKCGISEIDKSGGRGGSGGGISGVSGNDLLDDVQDVNQEECRVSKDRGEAGGDLDIFLFHSAWDGHLQDVQKSVTVGANINFRETCGWTALMVASNFGHADVVQYLVNMGADLNIQSRSGYSALLYAAFGGHSRTVKILANAGADLDIQGKFGDTALTNAASKGHRKIVKILVTAGADLNIQTTSGFRSGYLALMLAASDGDTEIVEILLKAGVDLDIQDGSGSTVLMRAASYGHPEIVKILVNAGADVRLKNSEGKRARNMICEASFARCTEEDERKMKKWLG